MTTEATGGELSGDGFRVEVAVGPEFEMTDRVRDALEELSEAFGIEDEVSGFSLDSMGDPLGLSICLVKSTRCGVFSDSGNNDTIKVPINPLTPRPSLG